MMRCAHLSYWILDLNSYCMLAYINLDLSSCIMIFQLLDCMMNCMVD